MPTPPSSDEETHKQQEQRGDNDVGTGPSGVQRHRPPQPCHLLQEAQDVQRVVKSPYTSTLPAPPLLLTSSLHFQSEAKRNTLQAHLWSTNTSFTTSFSHLLSHVPFHAVTIALLDITTDPVKIAHEMHDMMTRLVALEDEFPEKGRLSGRVLFLDLRVLETMTGNTDDWIASVDPRSTGLFAGCLKWECEDNDDGRERNVKVTDCFDWKEAIGLDEDD